MQEVYNPCQRVGELMINPMELSMVEFKKQLKPNWVSQSPNFIEWFIKPMHGFHFPLPGYGVEKQILKESTFPKDIWSKETTIHILDFIPVLSFLLEKNKNMHPHKNSMDTRNQNGNNAIFVDFEGVEECEHLGIIVCHIRLREQKWLLVPLKLLEHTRSLPKDSVLFVPSKPTLK